MTDPAIRMAATLALKETHLRRRVVEMTGELTGIHAQLAAERKARRLSDLKLARIEAAIANEEPSPGTGNLKSGDPVQFSFQPDGPIYEAAIVSGGSVWLYDKKAGDYLPGAFDWYQLRKVTT